METTKKILKLKLPTCQPQSQPPSSQIEADPSLSEEKIPKSQICPYCGMYFAYSSGMCRHKKHHCPKRPKLESSPIIPIPDQHDVLVNKQPVMMILTKSHILTEKVTIPKSPTTQAIDNVTDDDHVQCAPSNIEVVSQLRETQKQMTLMLQKQEEEKQRQAEERQKQMDLLLQKQEEERQRHEEEKQKQEEDRRQLLEAIQTLSKTQGTQNNTTNITINNNVTVFFNSSLNIYDKKKKAHGAQSAIEFLHQTLVEARPSNKFSWILDRDIIGTSQSPLSINENGEFVVHMSEKEVKVCSLSQINQLGNSSMSTSVMHAVSDNIGIYTDRFSKATDEERDQTEDFFEPLHSGPFGHDILGNLVKYRQINPTQKHVVDIAGGTKLKLTHH